jgi:hypothetical protein
VNNQSAVEVMKDGKISTVQVEIGGSNDTQTEIISGLNEGDEVVTSTITPSSTSQSSNSTTSPFSSIGGGGLFRTRTTTGGGGGIPRD